VAVLCDWEDNRRSGVVSAMRHRVRVIAYQLRAQRPQKGDEHPALAPAAVWHPLT